MPEPNSTLSAIQTKVRRLTRNPSESMLTTDEINEYVNTFMLYDMPEHLRQFALKTTFTFVCNPFQDVYNTDTASFVGATNNPLYDFQNKFLTIESTPLYIAGYQQFYSQSRSQFFAIYPLTNSIASIGVQGNGTNTYFQGVVNSQQAIVPQGLVQQICLLKNNVLFSSVNALGAGCQLIDVPLTDPTTGNPTIFGNLYDPSDMPVTPPLYPGDLNPVNSINYLTGVFAITFSTPPASGANINSQTIPQNAAIPQAMLYYDNKFTLRPVPDQPYRINFEVYVRPAALFQSDENPQLNEWWQYIAYGAAKKVFEDRSQLDDVQLIFPEFTKQEDLCLRRTIVQNTNQRTATIYTEQVSYGPYSGGWGYPGGPF